MPSRLPNANEILQEELAQCKKDTEKLYGEWHRFESIAEYAPLGLALIDKDGNFCYINPKFREMFGYDPDEISKGRDWFRRAYPDPTYRHNAISTWINDSKDCATWREEAPDLFRYLQRSRPRKSSNSWP